MNTFYAIVLIGQLFGSDTHATAIVTAATGTQCTQLLHAADAHEDSLEAQGKQIVSKGCWVATSARDLLNAQGCVEVHNEGDVRLYSCTGKPLRGRAAADIELP